MPNQQAKIIMNGLLICPFFVSHALAILFLLYQTLSVENVTFSLSLLDDDLEDSVGKAGKERWVQSIVVIRYPSRKNGAI